MAIVTINTPRGPLKVDIEGMSPSEEEMEIIKENVPAPDGEEFDYTLSDEDADKLSGMGNAPSVEVPQVNQPTAEVSVPSPEIGEIENRGFRVQYGRADTDAERELFLTDVLGEGSFEKVAPETFIVDQSKVSPSMRKTLGLADSGFVYVDKPTFSSFDIADFVGGSGPGLAAGIGSSVAVMGSLPALPAALVVGGAAALARAADEAIEYFQGYNSQSAGEVGKQIFWTGVENMGGELLGRGIGAVAGRVLKGRGPEIPPERVDEIIASNPGMKQKEAEKIVLEEVRAYNRELINRDVKMTPGVVAGKDISNTMLAVNEMVVPNTTVGKNNLAYIKSILEEVNAGNISEEAAKEALQREGQAVAKLITDKLDDPEAAFNLAQQHLKGVVQKELDIWEKLYDPTNGVPSSYTNILPLATKLFQAESSALYKNAEKVIGETGAVFNMGGVRAAVGELRRSNSFVNYDGKLFNIIEETPSMTLEQLTQLKQALRLSIRDPELVPQAAQAGVSKIINAVDETIDSRFVELSRDLALGYRTVKLDNGNVFQIGLGPTESDSLRQGLALWKQANQFYTDGQKQFNNAAVNVLMKNAKDNFYNSNIDVLQQTVEQGNAPKLKMYLDAVTPKGKAALELSKSTASESLKTISRLVSEGNYSQANALINKEFPGGAVPKINDFISKLGPDDVYTRMHLADYTSQIEELNQLAIAGANPVLLREAARNGLAKTWINRTIETSKLPNGKLNAPAFAKKYRDLGPDVQDTLFGKDSSEILRATMNDAYILGRSGNEILENASFVTNKPLKEQLLTLKQSMKVQKNISNDNVLKILKDGGPVEEPEKLIAGLIESPKSFNRLKTLLGEGELEKVGGIKDMAMRTLLSKVTLSPEAVNTGQFGQQLGKAISELNKKGGLTSILGKEVVSKLEKLAKDTITMSGVGLKSIGSLAGATARTGAGAEVAKAGTALLTFGLLGSINSIGSAAIAVGVPVITSRLLRSKVMLNYLTSNRLRADLYDDAIKSGANIPTRGEAFQANPVIWTINNYIAPAVNRTASLIAAAGVGGGIRGTIDEITNVQDQPTGSQVPQNRRPITKSDVPETIDVDVDFEKARQRGAFGPSSNPLRQTEINKLLGVTP
jgi:hypothetical protein